MAHINPKNLIKSVILSPAGEYSYSVSIVNYSNGKLANLHHNDKTKSDIVLSIEQLKNTLPNVEWIAIEVPWFANSVSLDKVYITPKIEHNNNFLPWKVANYDRNNAGKITTSSKGELNYGGTPTDQSILELCSFLKNKNYKIMLSPLIFVDDANKSWRGFISPEGNKKEIDKQIHNFFHNEYGYNKFILHYADLLKNEIDVISIGNELKGLTFSAGNYGFPAIDELKKLASEVKKITGPSVKTTYIANYGEYHHNDKGLYALDSLWGSEYIDIVTINALFPLTNNLPQEEISCRDVKEGWKSGEGVDYYFSGSIRIDFEDQTWSSKNFEYWYKHLHFENGASTEWDPEKGKQLNIIYSFASIAGITNNPGNFYTWNSPIPDFKAQSLAILASELFFNELEIVSQSFISHWDARPFPYYPQNCHDWSDCKEWNINPALNGKIGNYTFDSSSCGMYHQEL